MLLLVLMIVLLIVLVLGSGSVGQARQDRFLPPEHLALSAVGIIGVLVTKDVKRPVDDQPQQLEAGLDAILGGRLAGDLRAYVDVTQWHAGHAQLEGDHVGGLRAIEMGLVEGHDGLAIDEGDGDFAPFYPFSLRRRFHCAGDFVAGDFPGDFELVDEDVEPRRTHKVPGVAGPPELAALRFCMG